MQRTGSIAGLRSRHPVLALLLQGGAWAAVVALVALSAIVTKEARLAGGLSALAEVDASGATSDRAPAGPTIIPVAAPIVETAALPEASVAETEAAAPAADLWPSDTRWFNGRPVRPVKTIYMTVTAYSPDERSCGKFADGQTASLHSVWTNNMNLVAADSRVLPLGSMITIPGYAGGDIVPVLDRGGAIKGHRLDVLYPTHQIARQWGVQRLPVVVWEYADGEPKDDFRAIRDSRN